VSAQLIFIGIEFPFTLHSFRELDAGIDENAFKKLMERLINGVSSKSARDKEEDLDSAVAVKAMSKEDIASLSKSLPHQLKMIEHLKAQIDKGEKDVFPEEDRIKIIQWVQDGNADNLNNDEVSGTCRFLTSSDSRISELDQCCQSKG
jgi:hypothetical protein